MRVTPVVPEGYNLNREIQADFKNSAKTVGKTTVPRLSIKSKTNRASKKGEEQGLQKSRD